MTRTTPWRWMILHLSHNFFTDARTFIDLTFRQQLQNSSSRPILSRKRNPHAIPYSETHKIRSLRAGKMNNELMLSFQSDTHESARQ
jgi:hypothetical protein